MPTQIATRAIIPVSTNSQRGNGSGIAFPPRKSEILFQKTSKRRGLHLLKLRVSSHDIVARRDRFDNPSKDVLYAEKCASAAFLLDFVALIRRSELSSYLA